MCVSQTSSATLQSISRKMVNKPLPRKSDPGSYQITISQHSGDHFLQGEVAQLKPSCSWAPGIPLASRQDRTVPLIHIPSACHPLQDGLRATQSSWDHECHQCSDLPPLRNPHSLYFSPNGEMTQPGSNTVLYHSEDISEGCSNRYSSNSLCPAVNTVMGEGGGPCQAFMGLAAISWNFKYARSHYAGYHVEPGWHRVHCLTGGFSL